MAREAAGIYKREELCESVVGKCAFKIVDDDGDASEAKRLAKELRGLPRGQVMQEQAATDDVCEIVRQWNLQRIRDESFGLRKRLVPLLCLRKVLGALVEQRETKLRHARQQFYCRGLQDAGMAASGFEYVQIGLVRAHGDFREKPRVHAVSAEEAIDCAYGTQSGSHFRGRAAIVVKKLAMEDAFHWLMGPEQQKQVLRQSATAGDLRMT